MKKKAIPAQVQPVVRWLREQLIILLRSKNCYTDKNDIEIPEELSAQFDIGLDEARELIKIFEQSA